MALKPLGKTTAPKPKTHKPVYNPSLALQKTPAGKRYLDHIRKMDPYQCLIYWIVERHRIHCKRFGLKPKMFGEPHANKEGFFPPDCTVPPWTEDPILQTIFFCNPYREHDKVTAFLRDNFREEYRDKPCIFLGTIMLRMFNHIRTMRRLLNANIPQRMGGKQAGKALDEMLKLLQPVRDAEEQVFGGAYIIIFKPGERKVERAYECLQGLLDKFPPLDKPYHYDSMQDCFDDLISCEGMGQFYIYQYIGDLAYTRVLENASDWDTWGYCGPGTARGLYRLQGITEINGVPLERRCPAPKDAMEQLEDLQVTVNKDLKKEGVPRLHMRDLCNCLCEYDKYNRALNNERHVKRPYQGR